MTAVGLFVAVKTIAAVVADESIGTGLIVTTGAAGGGGGGGGGVIVHDALAIPEPKAFMARTTTLCWPTSRFAKAAGDVQSSAVPASRAQVIAAGDPVVVNATDAVVAVVETTGFAVIVTVGASPGGGGGGVPLAVTRIRSSTSRVVVARAPRACPPFFLTFSRWPYAITVSPISAPPIVLRPVRTNVVALPLLDVTVNAVVVSAVATPFTRTRCFPSSLAAAAVGISIPTTPATSRASAKRLCLIGFPQPFGCRGRRATPSPWVVLDELAAEVEGGSRRFAYRKGYVAMTFVSEERPAVTAGRFRIWNDHGMPVADELAYATATDLARRIRARELSPVEVVDAAIARIEERNPSITAFVFEGFDDARAAASVAEAAVMAGDDLGPLHGVPVAIKDLFDFKPGWKSTFGGIPALRDLVIDTHCLFAERIEAAGAVIVGKTNSPVMGFRGTCDNPLFGPSRNPFDTTRNTGGSSGGSAGAVADGLVSIAEGTDGGGSIRIPAAWCGVYGYKPSFGRVPFVLRPNGFGSTSPFLFEGPITRTVDDAALALTALNGYDSRDAFALAGKVDYRDAPNGSIAGLRIAYSPELGVYPVDPAVAEAVRRAANAFTEAGATVEEVAMTLPYDHLELADLWCRMIIPINCAGLQAFTDGGIDLLGEHRNQLPPEYLRFVDQGFKMSVVDVLRDQEMRTTVHDAVRAVLDRYDLLLSPTLSCLPVKNADDRNTVGPSHVNGVEVQRLIGWCMTYFFNYTGHPAATVPAGLIDGLPIGLQIVGQRYADDVVLAASGAFERLRPWHHTYAIPRTRSLAPA